VSAINRGIFKVAELIIMPRKDVMKHFLETNTSLRGLLKPRTGGGGGRGCCPPEANQHHPSGPDVERDVPVFTTPNYRTQSQPHGRNTARGTDNKNDARPVVHSPARDNDDTSVTLSNPTDDDDDNNTNVNRQDQEEHDLARQLAITIKAVAHDLQSETPKRYTYEEWEHFTKLIRFSTSNSNRDGRSRSELSADGRESHDDDDSSNGGNSDPHDVTHGRHHHHHHSDDDEDEEDGDSGPVEWDWIGEDSPMLADITEGEWVLDRLCESLNRYTRRQRQQQG
jgi:hypothetical protein